MLLFVSQTNPRSKYSTQKDYIKVTSENQQSTCFSNKGRNANLNYKNSISIAVIYTVSDKQAFISSRIPQA